MKKVTQKIVNSIKNGGGKIYHGMFIDAYNQNTSDISITLLASPNCFHGNGFVVVSYEKSGSNSIVQPIKEK